MKLVYLDFEYHSSNERDLHLVSLATMTTVHAVVEENRSFWLHDSREGQEQAAAYLGQLVAADYVFVAYAAEAECRAMLTLFGKRANSIMQGLKVIDLYLEYRMLLNHNHRYAYGKQLIDGRVITTKPPPSKWMRREGDENSDKYHKPSYSLAAATYKLLNGRMVDTVEKDEVRALILSKDAAAIEDARERILTYNAHDVENLQALQSKILTAMARGGLVVQAWIKAAQLRGDYARRSAMMVQAGYPVNMAKVRLFVANVKQILKAAAEDCIDSDPSFKPFRWDKKQEKYVASEKLIRSWVAQQLKPHWRKTKGNKLSISRDAFKDWYTSESPGFPGAYCRFLKTKQSLNGFLPGGGKRGNFFENCGADDRVRPYFGIYGSQSSRSQPSATSFIPLKAHWMRNFIEPPKGRAICGIDYASQEFLIAAIVSQDPAMMEAYESGDVYLAFGKAAGLIPPEGTKETHKAMRDLCKALVLGISYDMSARGLAPRLTGLSGQEVTEARAQELINIFYDVYCCYSQWKNDIVLTDYEEMNKLELPDGWVMWGDNDNRRSVGNFPIQGLGAVIMREAVRRAQDAGLEVIFTLHDAIYVEFDSMRVSSIARLMRLMQTAFRTTMLSCPNVNKVIPIRLEGDAWSMDYGKELPRPIKDVVYMEEYTDAKGKQDLERYRKFFQQQ